MNQFDFPQVLFLFILLNPDPVILAGPCATMGAAGAIYCCGYEGPRHVEAKA